MIPEDMITKEALREFKAIYREQYGKDISDKDALDLALNLLTIMDVVYRPVKKEWVEALEKRDKNART